ncbi:hypothetical protein [Raoultella lignicola]|uniref:Uncharacterized protein n=1 Tax=Raoultella lignicola TaxID=3040939 RepID=A0ABU9FAG1_9ENTR
MENTQSTSSILKGCAAETPVPPLAARAMLEIAPKIFFLQGMRHILDDYFLAKGMSVRFTPANSGHRANLIVNSAFPWGGEKKTIKITVIHEHFWGIVFIFRG